MIELKKITLSTQYRKKWNVRDDVFHLYKDDEKVSDNLYGLSGLSSRYLLNKYLTNKDKYFIIFKLIESMYEDHITNDEDKKLYLARHWCIINNEGKEMRVFDEFSSPYLCGGVIYCVDKNYYNIETNQLYCQSFLKMDTENYLFLHDEFNEDRSKRGVLKINKNDGTYEFFK